MKRSDKNEFAAFCRNATDSQIDAIIEKEITAGRKGYADIARHEREIREARAEAMSATRRGR